jgi:hypothetical protein
MNQFRHPMHQRLTKLRASSVFRKQIAIPSFTTPDVPEGAIAQKPEPQFASSHAII